MTDQDTKIRGLLKDMADEIPSHHTVPPSIQRRVRQRIAMNSVGIGAMLAVLAVGIFGGVRALTPESKPTKVPFGSTAPSTPASTSPQTCTAGQLRAIGSMSGAAGSRVGFIELRNYSTKACTLTGRPVIGLYQNGQRINTGLIFASTVAQWEANAAPKPAGWPVVTVGAMGTAHNSARVRISWSNWCPQGRAFPLWRVFISNTTTVDVIAGMETAGAPPCNGPSLPSRVEVGPFEP